MSRKKEARPALESKRASVKKDVTSIPQSEWERGCRVIPWAFVLMTVFYAVWEVLM